MSDRNGSGWIGQTWTSLADDLSAGLAGMQRLNDAARNVFKTYWPLMVLALIVITLVIIGVVAVIPAPGISRGSIP